MNNKLAVNPITLKTARKQHLNLVIGRMHVGFTGRMEKLVQFAMFDPARPDEDGVKGFTVIDEDLFLDGIGHLFPAGELSRVHLLPGCGESTTKGPTAFRDNPVGQEVVLDPARPCVLGVGRLSFAPARGVAVRLYGSYFGQEDREWDPDDAIRARIDQIPGCMVDRDQAGTNCVSAMFKDVNEMLLKLPGVVATIEQLTNEGKP